MRRCTVSDNSRMARVNRPQVSVAYYESCGDADSEAYGLQDQYKTITDIFWNVGSEVTQTITIDRTKLSFRDALMIEADSDIFKREWDDTYDV